MVKYPTILGLSQEDIDRQLYLGVLGLERRVKDLEDNPKQKTGTVTVTCIDESEQPVSKCQAFLGTEPILEPPQTGENLVAYGRNESGNEITLQTFDPETFLPIGTDIPYGTYYIYADNDEADRSDLLVYTGEVTVDNATIEETFTLTPVQVVVGGREGL